MRMEDILNRYKVAFILVYDFIKEYLDKGEEVKIGSAVIEFIKEKKAEKIPDGETAEDYMKERNVILSILYRKYYFSDEEREKLAAIDEEALISGHGQEPLNSENKVEEAPVAPVEEVAVAEEPVAETVSVEENSINTENTDNSFETVEEIPQNIEEQVEEHIEEPIETKMVDGVNEPVNPMSENFEIKVGDDQVQETSVEETVVEETTPIQEEVVTEAPAEETPIEEPVNEVVEEQPIQEEVKVEKPIPEVVEEIKEEVIEEPKVEETKVEEITNTSTDTETKIEETSETVETTEEQETIEEKPAEEAKKDFEMDENGDVVLLSYGKGSTSAAGTTATAASSENKLTLQSDAGSFFKNLWAKLKELMSKDISIGKK